MTYNPGIFYEDILRLNLVSNYFDIYLNSYYDRNKFGWHNLVLKKYTKFERIGILFNCWMQNMNNIVIIFTVFFISLVLNNFPNVKISVFHCDELLTEGLRVITDQTQDICYTLQVY